MIAEHYKKREKCASCGSPSDSMESILEFPDIPLAGDFPLIGEDSDTNKYPFSLLYCPKCHLVQSDSIIDPKFLFEDYRYISSIGLSKHFQGLAKILYKKFGMKKWRKGNRVMEIGSNSNALLEPLSKMGVSCFGFEPAKNIYDQYKDKAVVINEFFSNENARKLLKKDFVDLVVSCNCLAHIENVDDIIKGIKYALKMRKYLVMEVHYLKSLIDGLQYDNIYHEHIYYYSVAALKNLLAKHRMSIVDVEEIPIHSGSIRVTIINEPNKTSRKVEKFIRNEVKAGICNLNYYKDFSKNVNKSLLEINATLNHLKKSGKKVIGFGASGRATMLCNLANIDESLIEYIVDESPERYGRCIANKKIPILKSISNNEKPDYVFIFAWNYARAIINKLDGNGYKFIIPLPELKIINGPEEFNQLNFNSI